MSHALTMLSALFVCTSFASAQFSGMEDGARIGIMGPDGQMEFLPTAEEMQAQMAELNDRSPNFSAIAAYAQRRIELLGLVSEIVYVDDDAPVGGDGTSWATAHQSLQDALAQDYSDRLVKIRMAQGLYRADRFSGVNTMDREASFSPSYTDTDTPTGILRITGGFAGLGAKDPDQRDPEQFPTVITGDLKGNDGPDYENYDDNTLVLFRNFNSELHGLVLENAIQAMRGGQGNITVDGCLVQHHAGTEMRGAATFSGSGVLVVKRCTFYKNRSGLYGGAIDSGVLYTIIVSNRFLTNRAHNGGGLFSGGWGWTVTQNNYFAGNRVSGSTGSMGGAATVFSRRISACNTVAFNRSEDGPAGGFGFGWVLADQYTVLDVYHMNEGHSGTGLSEQFPSLPMSRNSADNPNHFIRGSFVQDWESSESNRPGTYASTLDSIRDNSGEEVLFVDLAGSDGVIGTLDDDPTPRPDSPNIDRVVDLEAAEIALLDFADLNENGIVHETLHFDLLGNPRSINTPGIGDPDGGIDAGAIEYAGDPARYDYDRLISGRRTDPMDDCEGDEPIRLYVNASGPVSGDGSSWNSPLLELYEALDIARTRCGPVEIWLATGTYLPDFSVPLWRASFRPTSNVTILGGFAGWEKLEDQRDPAKNLTVLSGDQYGNDLGDRIVSGADEALELMEDNAYRVVVSGGPRAGGLIDGVIITGGYPRARSYAGLFAIGEGCIFGLGPYSMGAGVTHLNGDLQLVNCTFSRSASRLGVALASLGTGTLDLHSINVADDQIRDAPCPAEDSVSQIAASGVDSILARPVHFSVTDTTLIANDGTTPFRGYLTGNLTVSLRQSDIDFATPPYGIDEDRLGPGRIDVREFLAESSLIRRCSQITSADTLISNSTLVGNYLLLFRPVARPPATQRLTLSNSIVVSNVIAQSGLLGVSEAINSIYGNTNFAVRTNEIRASTVSDFEALFVDALGPSGSPFIPDGDYRLVPGSPAINTGSNALVTSEFDLDGNPRIIGSVVDRGAYEFTGTCTGDVNGDGAVNLADLNLVLGNFGTESFRGDANGDGVVDMTDLSIVLAAFGQTCAE